MATADTIPAGAFCESEEKLAPVDERAAVVADLEDACARVSRIAWDCRRAFEAFTDLHDAVRNGGSNDLDALLAAQAKCVSLEKDLIYKRDEIEAKLAAWNTGRTLNDRIYVSHTAEGLPFRVSKGKRTPLWGF